MSDRPVISQDLARRTREQLRGEVATHNLPCPCSAHNLLAKLDALEQPPDPAEVAVTQYFDCVDGNKVCPEDHCGGSRRHLVYHIRQTHAERDEAVKELSDHIKKLFIGERDPSIYRGASTDIHNTRVRKLFGFDRKGT